MRQTHTRPERMPASVRSLAILAAAVLAACGESPNAPRGLPAELTALPRALSSQEVGVRDAANAFSFALWRTLIDAQRDENVFVSPLSASLALGMAMNGASASTYDEMRSALQFGSATDAEIVEGYRSLIALLTSLDASTEMRIANSIWHRQDFPFHQTFLDAGRTYFSAEVAGLDFGNAPASLGTINGWVSDHTNGRIPDIIDDIRPEHVMFLINAIYFKGRWRERFDERDTREASFRAIGGSQMVPLMYRRDTIAYAETADWQAVDLPYGNGAFSMTVVLPAEAGDVDTLARSLTAPAWAALVGSLSPQQVELHLPRLQLTYERTLDDDLRSLGMLRAFAPGQADFTRMSTQGERLYIDFVKQKTFVDVNEDGTEAAAATAVGVGVTSAPQVHIMRVDRPYVFALRERLTGTIVFLAKIVRVPAT